MDKVSNTLNIWNKEVLLTYGDLNTTMKYKELLDIMDKYNLKYDKTLSVLFSDECWLEIDMKEISHG